MLRKDTFWGYEKDAPLLILNRGYLQNQGDTLYTRTGSWLGLVGLKTPEQVVLKDAINPHRIYVADAERTFRNDANRAQFVNLLAHVAGKFGDYAQGMSYVASFLSLTLRESEVVPILLELNFNEKYLPGYWKHEAVKFAIDAYVFQELALKFVPKVAQHLQKNQVDPSSYCQKWFVGLCVHVLPFQYLFQYYEGFFKGGYKFLFQFGLSLINQLQDKLLAVHNNHHLTFGLLRLDPKIIPHDAKFDEMVNKVFEGTKDYNLDGIDFTELRQQAYDKNLKARMENAKKHNEANHDSDDEIEDCPLCDDDLPEVYCTECKIKICESCHNKPPADSKHLRAHKVKPLDDSDEDEEEEDEEEEGKEEKPSKKDESVDKLSAGLQKLNV